MKRWKLLPLLCAALCFFITAARAESEAIQLNEAFRIMAGRISFTLPAVPELILEPDFTMEQCLERGGPYAAWTDKIQLAGETEEEAEFRAHIMNVRPMLDWMKENHPGESEDQYPFHALLNLAQYFAQNEDGVITDMPTMGLTGPEDAPLPVVLFAYRNTRSAEWHYGKAMIDGDTAVVLLVREAPETIAVIKDMHAATAAERAAYDSRAAETVNIQNMQLTFPVPPETQDAVGHIAQHVLCPDGTYLNADYLEMPLWVISDGKDLDKDIKKFVKNTAEGYVERSVITDYEIVKAADGVYGFTAECQTKEHINGKLPVRMLMHCYVSVNGIYTVTATDTEAGHAFLGTVAFLETEDQ